MKAIYKGVVIAESSETKVVEGNHYFPPAHVKKDFLRNSEYSTTCPWKGKAKYYHVEVEGDLSENSAWEYPKPKEKATHITGHIAFWKDVKVAE